jgi:hypothetical protein
VFLDKFEQVLNHLRNYEASQKEDEMVFLHFIRFNLPSVVANFQNMSGLVALSNRYNDSTILQDFIYCFNKIAKFLEGFKNESTAKNAFIKLAYSLEIFNKIDLDLLVEAKGRPNDFEFEKTSLAEFKKNLARVYYIGGYHTEYSPLPNETVVILLYHMSMLDMKYFFRDLRITKEKLFSYIESIDVH